MVPQRRILIPLLLAVLCGLLTLERASGQDLPVAPVATSAVTTEAAAVDVSADANRTVPESAPVASVPLERQPYRVRLIWGMDEQSGPVPAAVIADLDTSWAESATRMAGPLWKTSVAPWPAAWPVSLRGLSEVTAAQVSTLADEQADVFLLAVIGASHDGLVVRSRLWQPLLDWESPVVTQPCRDGRMLGDLLVGFASRAMRWHGLVERRPDRQWQMVMQGLDLLGPDQASPVVPGSLLSMTVEQLQHGAGPEPVIIQRTPVRWTFFEVTSLAQGIAQGRLLSGVRSPLPERPRRRLRTRAATVPTWGDTTTLELVVRGTQPREPLAGLRVEIAIEEQAAVETSPTDAALPSTTRTVWKTIANRVTDRRGQVPITTISGHRWQWVTVWSGTQRLARIPCVPGQTPRLELELPDDRPRLAVETELAAIELALIETVARRSAQLAALRRQARGDDAAGALKKLDTIATGWLTRDAVRSQIAGVRVAGGAVARAQGNRDSVKRIELLCQQLTALADEHLTEPIPHDLRLEITDLANLQAQTAADIRAAPANANGPRRRIE